MKSGGGEGGSALLAWRELPGGPHAALGRRVFQEQTLLECLPGEILHPPQLLAGNLWLDGSMSEEPEPKALWFPGVTTALCRRKRRKVFWLRQHVLHLGFIEDFTKLETQLPAPFQKPNT